MLISERVLKGVFSLKRGIVMFHNAKNLAVNHLPLERDLDVQTGTSNRKPHGKALITCFPDVCGLRENKTSILKSVLSITTNHQIVKL